MGPYIIRRLLYAIPILIGVNIITFTLFFVVNSPDDMARVHLGVKRVTPDAIAKWKQERGYNKPLLFNPDARCEKNLIDLRSVGLNISFFRACHEKIEQSIFFYKSFKLFSFDFGRSDQGRAIGYDVRT